MLHLIQKHRRLSILWFPAVLAELGSLMDVLKNEGQHLMTRESVKWALEAVRASQERRRVSKK